MINPSILVQRLILVGHRKNYIVPFNRGVNIIYGDSTTGKSSVLELINYLLGSSTFIYDSEIESSINYVALEVNLNNQPYLITRDIFDSSKLIAVYPTDFENQHLFFPKKYAPNSKTSVDNDGLFSDFLLDALNLPILKVREAPTKADSPMVRLSFRDVFKYCYLKQDDVGSKQILSFGTWAVHSKNMQTFRYFFNLLDTNITDSEAELSRLISERNHLENKYESISDFLRETKFASAIGIEASRQQLQERLEILRNQLSDINNKIVADSERYNALKSILTDISTKILVHESERASAETAIDRYSRLKNDYVTDINKIKAVRLAKDVIGVSKAEHFTCPICDTKIDLKQTKEKFEVNEKDNLGHESNLISRRIKELDQLIDHERNTHRSSSLNLAKLTEEQLRARRMLDEETAEIVTPYLSERDGISAEFATTQEKLRQLDQSLRVRNQHKYIQDEIAKLHSRIGRLQESLEKLKKNAPSLTAILGTLGDLLDSYLERVNIKDRRDVRINEKNFLPILRNREYSNVTSGGLRTILSIGYFASLLKYSLSENTNLPSFLMIDTVGKYLAKTHAQYNDTDSNEDKNENISDPTKYSNIYEFLIEIAEAAEDSGKICQIILVDNDVPRNIQEKYAGFIAAHYSSSGENGLPFGLIDDIQQA